jgi:hypothetical protein
MLTELLLRVCKPPIMEGEEKELPTDQLVLDVQKTAVYRQTG